MATLNEKIDAFETHVLTRQLRIGEILGDKFIANQTDDELSQSAFVILGIGVAYFEMIAQFASGQDSKGKSQDFFETGFKKVYCKSSVSVNGSDIYTFIRCGMFHTGMPTDRCGLSRNPKQTFTIDNRVLIINPACLITDLKRHLEQYCKELRNPDNSFDSLRQNFEKTFDRIASKAPTTSYGQTDATGPPYVIGSK